MHLIERRRDFLGKALAAGLVTTRWAVGQTAAQHQFRRRPGFLLGNPASNVLPKFDWLPSSSFDGTLLHMSDPDLIRVTQETERNQRWYDKRLDIVTFKPHVDRYIAVNEHFNVPQKVTNMLGVIKDSLKLIDLLGLFGAPFCEEVLPVLMGIAIATGLVIAAESGLVSLAEYANGFSDASALKQAMAANPSGFFVHALRSTKSGLTETIAFQAYDDPKSPITPFWRSNYTLEA
jgi:hypothetical protein